MKSSKRTDAYIAYTHRFFTRWVPVYDLFARSIFYAYRAAVRSLEPRRGRSILDLCTGTGEIALRCARQGAEVTGIDVTPAMLARARRKKGELAVRFQLMDARRLAFPDASFDRVVISFALHDMPRRVRLEVLR
ncbi:MAG: class I SAM-dependent methyltransferase, partial [bacterium]|nr:class I SAM-dependent methyltransferase [bacterium]